MAKFNTIKIARGKLSNKTTINYGELFYDSQEKILYIGDKDSNGLYWQKLISENISLSQIEFLINSKISEFSASLNNIIPKYIKNCDNVPINGANWYRLIKFKQQESTENFVRGYLRFTIQTIGRVNTPIETMEVFVETTFMGKTFKAGVVTICPNHLENVLKMRITSDVDGTEKYLEAFMFKPDLNVSIKAQSEWSDFEILNSTGTFPHGNNSLHVLDESEVFINSGVSSSRLNLKEYIDSNLIKMFSNGYVQWPGMPAPDTYLKFTGYRWKEVNYNGVFFRAKGNDALPFGSEEQGDAIRNIISTVSFDSGNMITSSTGAFVYTTIGTGRSWSSNSSWNKQKLTFDAERVVPTADEIRPRNKTIIIWQLEEII